MNANKSNDSIENMFIKVPIPVFPSLVLFSFNQTNEEIRKELSESPFEFSEDDFISLEMDSDVNGRCVDFSNGVIVIRMKVIPVTIEDYSCLQHEIMHAVIFICNRIETPLLIDVTDEIYCHLVGFLTKEIYNHLE